MFEFCPWEVWYFVSSSSSCWRNCNWDWKQTVPRSSSSLFCVFAENVRATTSVMLSEEDILGAVVLTIFNEMEVQNSPLKISFSWRRLFSVHERPTTSFPPALHLTDSYAYWPWKQAKSYWSSFSYLWTLSIDKHLGICWKLVLLNHSDFVKKLTILNYYYYFLFFGKPFQWTAIIDFCEIFRWIKTVR